MFLRSKVSIVVLNECLSKLAARISNEIVVTLLSARPLLHDLCCYRDVDVLLKGLVRYIESIGPRCR